MMKKAFIGVVASIAMLTLTGCQHQKKASISKETGTANVQNNSSRTFGSKSDNFWNSDKQDELDDFFDDWATGMDQEYEKYDGTGQIATAAGEQFPKDFNKMYLNGQKVSMGYEPTGKGNNDYNVVAIYNYDKGQAASHITYFFAFHDGKPIVLVDETTNGDQVRIKETANKDLIDGFNQIAAGQNPSTDDSDNSDNESNSNNTEDPKLIGTFIGLLKAGDWFKDNIKDGHMYYGSDCSSLKKLKGFDCITTGGAPDSYFWFKQDGDDVIVKYSDTSNGHSVSDGFYKTEHYTVERLKKDYYVNSAQKQEVDGYVAELKSLK